LFKNLSMFRIGAAWSASSSQVEDLLQKDVFQPCGASQPQSAGWVPPRGEAHGPLLEVVDGQWLLRLKVERKLLPGSVVRERADEIALGLEHSTGRKPGRKQMKELREQATLELLPQAFARASTLWVWIDPARHLLAIDTGSAARAEEVITLLVKALPGFEVRQIHTVQSPQALMSDWLVSGEPAVGFTVDRECELKSADEMKSVVRYARHRLDTDEVRAHIQAGKQPTRLALTWAERVSFVLTEGLQLKRLDFLDGVYEGRPSVGADEAFDADVAIATGELRRLIPDLIEALGGEQEPGVPPAAPALVLDATPAPADAAPW
jgi:recombination associated protein RdgC